MGTIWLNGGLLFVLLFYTYPLKFLFSFLTAGMLGHWDGYFDNYQQLQELMLLYGFGFALVYGLLAGLYLNAYRQRRRLELTSLEEALTRNYIVRTVLVAMVGLVSCLMVWVLPARHAGYAGMAYWLVLISHRLNAWLTRRKLADLRDAQLFPPLDPDDVEII